MMKNKKKILTGSLAILALGLIFYSEKKPPMARQTQQMARVQKQTEAPKTKPVPTKSAESKHITITPSELNSLRSTLPDKLKVKEEFVESPHATPASLRKFANSMAPLMEKALKNGDDANILINELHDCALDESVAQSARATCVVNSERLAKNHPLMKSKASEMRANVSPDVQKILGTRDKLIKK